MWLSSLVESFVIARRADGRAARTVQDYYRVLNPFAEWLAERELSRDEVRGYVADLRGRGWSVATVGIHVRNLRAFLRWLSVEGLTSENFALAVRAPGQARRLEVPITEAEIALLLSTCGEDFYGLRDRALILVFYDSGLRCGELVGLVFKNWRRDSGVGSYFLVWASKTRTERYVVLGRVATLALCAFLDLRGVLSEGAPVFCDQEGRPLKARAVGSILVRRAERAGLPRSRCHPHIFRKAFATAFLDNGGDSERLRVLAGWSTMEMVRVYADSSLTRLQGVHVRAGPVDRMMAPKEAGG